MQLITIWTEQFCKWEFLGSDFLLIYKGVV